MGYRPGSYLLKYAESQYWLRGVADIIERDEGFIIEGLKDAVKHHGARSGSNKMLLVGTSPHSLCLNQGVSQQTFHSSVIKNSNRLLISS